MLEKSNDINLNFTAADFYLKNIDGKYYNLNNLKGKNGTIIIFICNHCPYVKAIADKIERDTSELKKFGVSSIAIMSNDFIDYPEDNYENMILFSKKHSFSFPYLLDETQNIAKIYGAKCTPDFFGFNSKLQLRYRGRLDNSGMNISNNGIRELFISMEAISKNKKAPYNNPSIGCSIKWKSNG